MRRCVVAWLLIASIASCDGAACEIPNNGDGGPLAGEGEPCLSVWDCNRGLTCIIGRCAPAPRAPPDASRRSDARTDAAQPIDARTVDALPADAPALDASPPDA